MRSREEVRARARSLRMKIEAGDTLTLDEAAAACETRMAALSIFDTIKDHGDKFSLQCCGGETEINDGLLGSRVYCPRCGATACDAMGPMYSPLLERGNSFLTIPSEKFVALFGDATWIVTHEGRKVGDESSEGGE